MSFAFILLTQKSILIFKTNNIFNPGECASKSKIKRENPRSKIGGKQEKEKKFPIKDQKKEKEKYTERSLDQTTSE